MIFPLIEYYESISSTSDRVKELLRVPQPKLPCLVVSQRQTAGRGRAGKAWWSADGALLMSLGVDIERFGLKRDDLPQLSLMVGRAIQGVLRERFDFGERCVVRPPNDVYVDGRKIAGILIESPLPRYAVIGVGVNVNNRTADIPLQWQAVLRERNITSLIDEINAVTEIPQLMVDILKGASNNLFFAAEKTE